MRVEKNNTVLFFPLTSRTNRVSSGGVSPW